MHLDDAHQTLLMLSSIGLGLLNILQKGSSLSYRETVLALFLTGPDNL